MNKSILRTLPDIYQFIDHNLFLEEFYSIYDILSFPFLINLVLIFDFLLQ